MNAQTQEVTGAVTTANALKMAKKELNHQRYGIGASELSFDDVIKAIDEALEQPAQEPNITQIIKKYKGEMTYYDHEPLGVYFTIGHFEKLLNELKG
jgi:hypothetical protein